MMIDKDGNPVLDEEGNQVSMKYWYAKYSYNESTEDDAEKIIYEASSSRKELSQDDSDPIIEGTENLERYSDAYDTVESRIKQIEHPIMDKNGNPVESKSQDWRYEIDGVIALEEGNDTDAIEAYTSTIELEVEYTKEKLKGSRWFYYYRYDLGDVDFGITPRAIADMDINSYISNIKIYLQDGTKQLDVDFELEEDGEAIKVVRYNNDEIYNNIVIPTSGENSEVYLDGLVEIILDETLFNGATMEIKYKIDVINNSEPATYKYFYSTAKGSIEKDEYPIAISYYGEDLDEQIFYEGDNGGFLQRFENTYKAAQSNGDPLNLDIRSRVVKITNYVDQNLTFVQKDKLGKDVNVDWQKTSQAEFVSTREVPMKKADGTEVNIMDRHVTILRPIGIWDSYESYLDYLSRCANLGQDVAEAEAMKGENGKDASPVYRALRGSKGKEEKDIASTTLTLSQNLSTSSTGANTDMEYANYTELIRIENYAGKVSTEERYDITGDYAPESSTKELETIKDAIKEKLTKLGANDKDIDDKYNEVSYRTMGMSKAETTTIHAPTGLNKYENMQSNIVIVLIVLVIFATGIVLIKKFVLTSKNF